MDLIKDLFKGDKVIWIIFLFLCLISIVEVFSAASTLTYKSGDHWGPITQHSVILMVGVCIVVLVHNIPYKYFRVFPVFLLPLSTLLLIFVMGMGLITGDRVNGAARWMTFFGIQFQPSELAKMAVIIVTAFILSKFQEEDGANPKAFKYIMWITGIVFILIAPENGSTAMLLFGVVFLMMIIGRVPWKQLLKLISIVGVIAVIFIGMIMVTPAKQYRDIPMMHRVETWQNRIKGFFEDKEAVPAAKYDIDKNAQIASIFRFYFCYRHRRAWVVGRRLCCRTLHLVADARRKDSSKKRKSFSRIPCHGYCHFASFSSYVEYDGGSRSFPCYRTTIASHQ